MSSDHRILSAAYKRGVAELSAILFRLDPIGINFGGNTDEYDPEAATILPRLRSCRSAGDVRAAVGGELVRWFGPEVAAGAENLAALADEIWSWWRQSGRAASTAGEV